MASADARQPQAKAADSRPGWGTLCIAFLEALAAASLAADWLVRSSAPAPWLGLLARRQNGMLELFRVGACSFLRVCIAGDGQTLDEPNSARCAFQSPAQVMDILTCVLLSLMRCASLFDP